MESNMDNPRLAGGETAEYVRRATFDSREVRPGMTFIALKGEKADGRDFIPQAVANGATRILIGQDELERAAKERRAALRAKVVGVTGSAGKTTTKELLKAFLSKIGKTHATEGNFNNHIGLPLTILDCPDDADFLVLEMGTNHPGEIAHLCEIALPDSAVLTNVGTAHIEFFGTREAIAREKGVLIGAAKEFGVVNADCFGLDEIPRERRVFASRPSKRFEDAVANVLPGRHNLANASLAFTLANRYGLDEDGAIAALEGFALPGARWRKSSRDGVNYIDDTYNANPDSMVAALETFAAQPCAGRRIAVLGDMFELGERSLEFHRLVFEKAAALPIDLVIAVGEMSAQCKADASYPDAAALHAALGAIARPGDTVLLKASHGMHLGLGND